MKNIFFFANFFPEDFTRGITKKVWAQMHALEELGYRIAYYTGYTENGVAVFDEKGCIVSERKYLIKKLSRVYRNQMLKKITVDFLKKEEIQIDIVYARYLFFDSNYLRMLKQAKKKAEKVVVEAHSYPNYIKGNYIMYPTYFIDMIYKKKAPQYVDLVAAISSVKNIWGIKTVNIDNGVDYIGTTVRQKKKIDSNTINIICVSYESTVHGYDRMIRGLANYYMQERTVRVKLLLVGTVLKETLKLIEKEKVEDYVELLGIKNKDELETIYNDADIGMGILAPQRMGTMDSSGLKTKEYIGKGIPFFYAGNSLKGMENGEYMLQFSADDSPIDVEKIVSFYENLDKDGLEQKIRDWGKCYSWTYQLGKVMQVLNEQ